MYISDELIDRFFKEDVPYIDLTTLVLGIGGQKGTIQFFSREDAVLCGTEEVIKILTLIQSMWRFKKSRTK
jgi:molybdenum transport protein